jgi:hypothetical protein
MRLDGGADAALRALREAECEADKAAPASDGMCALVDAAGVTVFGGRRFHAARALLSPAETARVEEEFRGCEEPSEAAESWQRVCVSSRCECRVARAVAVGDFCTLLSVVYACGRRCVRRSLVSGTSTSTRTAWCISRAIDLPPTSWRSYGAFATASSVN